MYRIQILAYKRTTKDSHPAHRAHGITDAMVADKPTFGTVYPEFIKFTTNSVLIAQMPVLISALSRQRQNAVTSAFPIYRSSIASPLYEVVSPGRILLHHRAQQTPEHQDGKPPSGPNGLHEYLPDS